MNKSVESLERLWETDFEKLTLKFETKAIVYNEGSLGGDASGKQKHIEDLYFMCSWRGRKGRIDCSN